MNHILIRVVAAFLCFAPALVAAEPLLEKRIDCTMNGVPKFKGQVIDCNSKRGFIVEQLPPPPVRIPKLE